MADDTFIREVDEQIRQDRAHELWAKYGRLIIAGAVLIVLATAAFTGWQYYQQNRSGAAGDNYIEAIDLSNEGKHDEALAALEKISSEGPGQYPALAQMRIASEQAAGGDKQAAMETFTRISGDAAFSPVLQEIARLRAGLLAVDLESFEQVESRLASLATAGGPFRHSAREALGIAALKVGQDQKALEYFSAVANDANAANGVRARVQLMLNLLAGKGVKAEG